MKYKVTGTYKTEEIVDTEGVGFKHFMERDGKWIARWFGHEPSEQELAMKYAEMKADYNLIDDDGHGSLSASWLDWEAEPVIQ